MISNKLIGDTLSLAGAKWFSASNYQLGSPFFMELGVLLDKSKGYIVNDTLTVGADIDIVSKVKRFL